MLNFLLYPTKERKYMFKHLTQEQRYHIEAYKKAGYSNKLIAKEIGVAPSTVGRELKRNSSPVQGRYGANSAHEMAILRKSANSSVPSKMRKDTLLIIEEYIQKDWSPEQVAAMLQIEYNISISFVHIYNYIYEDKKRDGTLHTHLRFYNKKRRVKYGTRCSNGLKNRVSISKRDKIVEEKKRLGDFEMDTIIGKGKRGAITTIVDRASAFVKISIPTTKKAIDIEKESLRLLTPFKEIIHTITSDNGLEFANHENISKALNCNYYFCHPYSSWERGLNEYTNGLIRQYIPKGSSFENITQERIQEIEDKINHRPRKNLGWRTPYEVFYGIKRVA
jgi:IS30 family transposase